MVNLKERNYRSNYWVQKTSCTNIGWEEYGIKIVHVKQNMDFLTDWIL